jgi:hypothetical protein
MRLPKEQIPVLLDLPSVTVRHLRDFGVASGVIGAEYFSLGAGTDIAPLLEGLDGDLCQAPHWGYLISGEVVVTFADGSSERVLGGDVFHWPAGHTVRVEADAEVVLFSPQNEHLEVMGHMARKLGVG